MGFTAFSLRIAAWGKKRNRQNDKSSTPIAVKAIGAAVVGFGLVASATGLLWQKSVTEFMTSAAWSAELELWLPFWPLEPFLPLLIIALGTWFYTHARRQKNIAVPRPSRI
jgi:hypothetical protein